MKKKNTKARQKGNPISQPSSGNFSANNKRPPEVKPRAQRQSVCQIKGRILLVDDDPESLDLFSALLAEAGYQVDKADHAIGAICAIVRAKPDLVLADIRMPIVDGRELVQQLKRHNDSRDIRVVALTGYDTPMMRESALKAGYDDYITKPIDPRRFPRQIEKLLRKQELGKPRPID